MRLGYQLFSKSSKMQKGFRQTSRITTELTSRRRIIGWIVEALEVIFNTKGLITLF